MVPTIDMTAPEKPLLSIAEATVRFGGVLALDGVTFDIMRGQICGLIGPNGAGKTTLFNCISRLYALTRGVVRFCGEPISETRTHRIAPLGIARTFQNLALFRTMTVLDNIRVGAHCRLRTGYIENVFRLPSVAREEQNLEQHVLELVGLLGLEPVMHKLVADLTFATQKRVELARALVSRPQLLLLDEPAGGLNHGEVEELRQLIVDLRDRLQLTILLVEHHMNLVMRVSDKVVVLNFGRKIAEGAPAEMRDNPEVIRAYLGSRRQRVA